jgi:hypothetical protein
VYVGKKWLGEGDKPSWRVEGTCGMTHHGPEKGVTAGSPEHVIVGVCPFSRGVHLEQQEVSVQHTERTCRSQASFNRQSRALARVCTRPPWQQGSALLNQRGPRWRKCYHLPLGGGGESVEVRGCGHLGRPGIPAGVWGTSPILQHMGSGCIGTPRSVPTHLWAPGCTRPQLSQEASAGLFTTASHVPSTGVKTCVAATWAW